MRRFWFLLMMAALLCCMLTASAEENALTILLPAEDAVINPGKAVVISFWSPAEGTAEALLRGVDGSDAVVMAENLQVQAGYNAFHWNGTADGRPIPAGDYVMTLSVGDAAAERRITVGSPAPYFLSFWVDSPEVTEQQPLVLSFSASEPALVTVGLLLDGSWQEMASFRAEEAGQEQSYSWKGLDPSGNLLTAGEYTLTLMLTGDNGITSTEEHISVTIEDGEHVPVGEETAEIMFVDLENEETEERKTPDQRQFTPSYGSPYDPLPGESNYWTTPMDITDEAAVWAMLTEPVTVLDNGKKNNQKTQVIIRKEPDENAEGVGVVTMVSQGVRILERGDEWTLIECYSSSFYDSKVKAWNMLVHGYVPTKYLKTIVPDQNIGYVVDKLTQRLYIFKEGHLLDTLLISTGHANEKQPWNETRSGEFLLIVPAVGGYEEDGMYIRMAIRFNGGDMMHQVPYSKAKDGGKYFGTFEPRLGTKASHGCIRVQRRKTPAGINAEWIWSNRKNNQKFLIWEDWQGRQIPYPDDQQVVYYNPKGGKYYHSSETCQFAKGVTFQALAYGELESGDYAKLERCTWCTPPMRKSEIDAINELYAPGGDHDPILTKAREKLQLK